VLEDFPRIRTLFLLQTSQIRRVLSPEIGLLHHSHLAMCIVPLQGSWYISVSQMEHQSAITAKFTSSLIISELASRGVLSPISRHSAPNLDSSLALTDLEFLQNI